MAQWFHSGIEGYCKAAAQMMGLPDNNSGWGNFGRDLFADSRFDDPVKASKTWTLSRFRNLGRSNRPVLFETSWLGKSGAELEVDAVHACMHRICDTSADSALSNLYHANYLTFAAGFRSTVLPAIEDGFVTERYHSADIARFSQSIGTILGELNPSRPRTFRKLVTALVAGLIYGPGHILAQTRTSTSTLRSADKTEKLLASLPEMEVVGVRLTQLFGNSAACTGYSEVFGPDKAILFGRNSDTDAYLRKCDDEVANEIAQHELLVFPIQNTHKNTSKEHGILACSGSTWYYVDFSSNGTCISNGRSVHGAHGGLTAIVPGDVLYMGQKEPAEDDEATYQLSTAVLVSYDVDEAVL